MSVMNISQITQPFREFLGYDDGYSDLIFLAAVMLLCGD